MPTPPEDESGAELDDGSDSIRMAERDVLSALDGWSSDQWEDLDALIRTFAASPRTRSIMTDMTKAISERLEYRQAAALVWMIGSGPVEDHQPNHTPTLAQLESFRFRHGSFVRNAIAVNTRGPDDWSELDVRFTETSFQKRMVRVEVRLLDDRSLAIETTGTGYARLVRFLAEEIPSIIERTDALDDWEEISESLTEIIKILEEAREISGKTKSSARD